MELENELLSYLNSVENDFTKQVQYANNAFKSSELPSYGKIIILKWILNYEKQNNLVWEKVHEWFDSIYFKDITRNEIDAKDVKAIIETMIVRITSENKNTSSIKAICNTTLLLLENRPFQQLLEINVELGLKLINSVLLKINCPIYYVEFLNKNIFHKRLLAADEFLPNFLKIVIPTFVKHIEKFDDKHVFLQVSKVVAKCIYYNNQKNYTTSINQFFTNQLQNECGLNDILKYLLTVHEYGEDGVGNHFKLIFASFAGAYENNSELIYKFFIILLHLVGFHYEVLPLISSLSPERYALEETPRNILLELLNVLEETKLDLKYTVNEITVTEFLRTILINSIIPSNFSTGNYKILTKIIVIDPTITQTQIEEILKFTLLVNEGHTTDEYEKLVLIIFDIFSKLHRTENLISKIVTVVSNHCNDVINTKQEDFNLEFKNILTKNILISLSQNIQNLASWQVINVFKTLLFSIKKAIDNQHSLLSGKKEYCFLLEFLTELMGTFLSSIRVAEHTVAVNVVEKTKKCLKELEDVLHVFGTGLLNMKHNCSLMRSFLNMAYHWAEVNMILKYYSFNQDIQTKSAVDYNFDVCNITYIHPYLTIDEWCLISERITNFGEVSCKQLLYKLIVQKVQALCIFEKKVSKEILQDLLRYLTRDLDDAWRYILQNKFLSNNLIPLMSQPSIKLLADRLVAEFDNFQSNQHVMNNTTILNAVIYTVITQCDKVISKRKRKHDEDGQTTKLRSTKICNSMTDAILDNEEKNIASIKKLKQIYESNLENKLEVTFKEPKVLELLDVARKFPVLFCKQNLQNYFLLYVFSLHKDMTPEFSKGNYKNLQFSLENIILGLLQQYKYKLKDIFAFESLCEEILTNFIEWKSVISLIIENLFRDREAIVSYESLITHIVDKLHIPSYMHCGICILNTLNKFKKIRLSKDIKNTAENYKLILCNKIYELVLIKDPEDFWIPGYVYIIKTFITRQELEKISQLETILKTYLNFALLKHKEFDKLGYLQLFNTVLQNKPLLKTLDDELPLEIWKVCKRNRTVYERFDEFSQLILLIVGCVSNDEFCSIAEDLLTISESLLNKNKHQEFGNVLKTWVAILTSNVNPVKTKKLLDSLEILLSQILEHLGYSEYNQDFFKDVLDFEITVVQTTHLHLSPSLVDLLISSITILLSKEQKDFERSFNLSASLLSNLLKYRKSIVMDRLPPYLQQYRLLLKILCSKSSADVTTEEEILRPLAECAFQLEKLTKNLVCHQKDMSRIAMYMIADILEQYEKRTIFPNVKMHLNNCLYSLLTICDQHAVSYLMRVLSTASTEIFKVLYQHYKKYYRFTGKA